MIWNNLRADSPLLEAPGTLRALLRKALAPGEKILILDCAERSAAFDIDFPIFDAQDILSGRTSVSDAATPWDPPIGEEGMEANFELPPEFYLAERFRVDEEKLTKEELEALGEAAEACGFVRIIRIHAADDDRTVAEELVSEEEKKAKKPAKKAKAAKTAEEPAAAAKAGEAETAEAEAARAEPENAQTAEAAEAAEAEEAVTAEETSEEAAEVEEPTAAETVEESPETAEEPEEGEKPADAGSEQAEEPSAADSAEEKTAAAQTEEAKPENAEQASSEKEKAPGLFRRFLNLFRRPRK